MTDCTRDHCRRLRRHQPQYQELCLPNGRHVGRYDPSRGVLEVPAGGGKKHYFDLALLQNTELTLGGDLCNNGKHDGAY